jgi:tRNA(Ile)-lysidine synthase
MGLLRDFKAFIESEHLFQAKDHLLLAVSGGVDSVVLCELCRQAGLNFSIAHCNFQLRGAESGRDEDFVRDLAKKYQVTFHVKRFDTESYAQQHKLSIQVAARNLRYEWFRELLSQFQARKVLTAHHANDNIETVLMNFFKGTGITGLRGILPKQGDLVRPLLFARKEALQRFAEENKLQWVEDSSNATDKYTRNYIRHQLMPVITTIYPQAETNLLSGIHRFREAEFLYRQTIEKLTGKLVEKKGEELYIPILKLKNTRAAGTMLYEILHPLNFTPKQTEEALHLLESETGKYIASATHRIFKNRNWLIIAPNNAILAENILIEQHHPIIQFALGTLHFSKQPLPVGQSNPTSYGRRRLAAGDANLQLPTSHNIAFLNAAEIKYPLILRKWKPGDYFYPLGMRKKKKLARFLIDNKLSATEKEKTWVLEMDKKILWVIGQRIDDRFKLTPGAKEIVRIECTFNA